jgi:hypothetical protein
LSVVYLPDTLEINIEAMSRKSFTLKRFAFCQILIFVFLSVQLNGQSETQDTLAQYLFPSFSRSNVKAKNGKHYTLLLNYNIVTEKMVFLQKGNYFDLANTGTVDTVFLSNKRFVPKDQYFLEVLVAGRTSFYIRNKGELLEPPRPAGYGTTTQLTSSNLLEGISTPQGYYNFRLPEGYTVNHTNSFWVRIDDKWTRFLNESQFLKIFPGREKELKQFIKENKLRINRREDLIRIGDFCNK